MSNWFELVKSGFSTYMSILKEATLFLYTTQEGIALAVTGIAISLLVSVLFVIIAYKISRA